MDFKSFLGRLGGNLSFWIGASFLVLLHSLMLIMRMPLEFYLPVTNEVNCEKKQARINQLIEELKHPEVVAFLKTIEKSV